MTEKIHLLYKLAKNFIQKLFTSENIPATEIASVNLEEKFGNFAYYHEDDHSMEELIPSENWEFVISENLKIREFSEKHVAPDGFGWTDCRVMNSPKTPLSNRKIRAKDIDEIMIENGFHKNDTVLSGTYSYVEEQKDEFAYSDMGITVFFSLGKDGCVNAIWFPFIPESEERVLAFGKIFQLLGKKYDLILADWFRNLCLSPKDPNVIDILMREFEEIKRLRPKKD